MVRTYDIVGRNIKKLGKIQQIQDILIQHFPMHQLCYHKVAGRDIFYLNSQELVLEIDRFVTHESDGNIMEVTFGLATPTLQDTRGFFRKIFESAPVANVIGKITIFLSARSTNPSEIHIETYGQDNLLIWKKASSDLDKVLGKNKVYIFTTSKEPIKIG